MESNYLVWIGNVIFELYKATLYGEIDTKTFLIVKDIVKRSKEVKNYEQLPGNERENPATGY